MEKETKNKNSKEEILHQIKNKYSRLSFWRRLFSWKDSFYEITSLIEQIEIKNEVKIELKYLINKKDLKEIYEKEIKDLKIENEDLKDAKREMISENKDLMRDFNIKEKNLLRDFDLKEKDLNDQKDDLVLKQGELQKEIDQHTKIMMNKTSALLNIFEKNQEVREKFLN